MYRWLVIIILYFLQGIFIFSLFSKGIFFLFFFKFTNRFFVILRERWIFVFRYLVVHIFLAKHFAHTFSLFRKKKFWRAFFLNNLGAGMFFCFVFGLLDFSYDPCGTPCRIMTVRRVLLWEVAWIALINFRRRHIRSETNYE